MNKIENIKNFALAVLESPEKCITEDEINVLIKSANSDEEKKLYINLYNFFLKNRSEEVIKNGKF